MQIFKTLKELSDRAYCRNFRQPEEDETEKEFREAFSNFLWNISQEEALAVKITPEQVSQ